MIQPENQSFDYLLVGGGLQSALLVLALRARRPTARIALVERDGRLGGNHTWCFHETDLEPTPRQWIEPLVAHRWAGYEVSFPGLDRRVDKGYAAITTGQLHEAVVERLAVEGSGLFAGCAATEVEPDRVVLEDGRTLHARLVVDSRGPESAPATDETGYQKFLGQEVRLAGEHRLERPVLMDAHVDQTHGFHFVYALPLGPDRLLVEDTYFNTSPRLEREQSRKVLADWCRARGWKIAAVEREEEGLLPMPWAAVEHPSTRATIRGGYSGGWFHPGTGYSLPVAARLADAIASHPIEAIHGGALRSLATEQQRQSEYCHFLNRLLFRWYPPHMRQHIFARFYRLPDDLIERFYALRLNPSDRVRLVVGRPPRGFSPRYRMGAGA